MLLRVRSRRCLFLAQHDLAVGAATAEAQAAAKQAADQRAAAEAAAKSAAQVVADRLPSLHGPDQPDAGAANPATPGTTPGGVVPKPLPTIHPDRYTVGTTPSAANLKPGAAERNTPTVVTNPPPSSSSNRDYPTTAGTRETEAATSTGVGPTSDWQLTTIN